MQVEPPVINIAALINPASPCEREKTVKEIGEACTKWGFFHVTHHGISDEIVSQFWQQMVDFFNFPKSEKYSVKRDANNSRGYFDDEFTKQKLDLKEGFDFGHVDTAIDGKSRWPVNHPLFKKIMLEYFGIISELSEKLLSAISESLSLPPEKLLPYFEKSHTSFLRLNYYPPSADPSAELGIHPHKDAGVLTVLKQDDGVPSLQVYTGTGTGMIRNDPGWVTVSPVAGAFTINIGDMMQVWSNDQFKAPLHRVLASKFPRYSAPFFYNPKYETDVVPLVGENPLYRVVNWGAFRSKRFEGDYADVGEEIQISHYKI